MKPVRAAVAAVLVVVAMAACDPRPPAGTVVLHRVNAGGEALAGGWSADTAAAPSPFVTTERHVVTSYSPDPIDLGHGSLPAGVPAELFRTQRVDLAEAPALRYDFPVPAGTVVQARVYLAETRHLSPGARRFDIRIDDVLAFDEVDVRVRSGGLGRGMVLWRQVTSDGTVSVEFAHGAAGDPTVAGIEIVSTSIAAPPDIDVSPTSIDFSHAYEIRDVTVTNQAPPGSLPLVLDEPTLSGAGAGAFVVVGSGTTLAPGASVTYLVGVQDTVGIPFTAQLVVESNDPDEPVVLVDLAS